MVIKVYCSQQEKNQIEKKAQAAGFSISKYLKRQAFADLRSRAVFVELVSNIVSLIEAGRLSPSVSDRVYSKSIRPTAKPTDCRFNHHRLDISRY